MTKTTDGKLVIWENTTGQQLERWPVDARILVNNGTHSLEAPEGVEAKLPPVPPRHAGMPQTPVAKVFEAPEPEATPAKKGKAG